jgi:hypothetical protein
MDNFRLQILNGQARRHEVISAGESVPAACGFAVKNPLILRRPEPSIFVGITAFRPIPAAMPLFYIQR